MGHWLGEDRRETLVREIAREYAFLHPQVDVDLRFPPEIMGVRSQRRTAEFLVEQVRKERPDWDVVWLDDTIYQHVADILHDPQWGAKHLVDFRQVPGFAAAHKPFIISDPSYAAQTGGILVGPYIEGEYTIIWLNRELTGQLGLVLPERGATWKDLLTLAEGLQRARHEGRSDAWLLSESSDWLTAQFLFQALVISRCGSVAEGLRSEATPAKRAAVREAVEAFAALGRFEPLIPSHASTLWIDTRRLPLEDRVLCFVAGTWMYSHWSGLDPQRMRRMVPVQLPVLQPVDCALGSYIPTWAVLRHAPGRDDGIALLRHLCSSDTAERWVAYTKNPTGLRGDLAKLGSGSDPFERFMLDMEHRVGSRVGRVSNPGYALGVVGSTKADAFNVILRELLCGTLDAETAMVRLAALGEWPTP